MRTFMLKASVILRHVSFGLLAVIVSAQAATRMDSDSPAARTNPPPDLSDYRTVASVITTQAVRSARAPIGQSGHLGVHVEADKRGKLIVDDVEADSPAARAGVQPGDLLLKVAGRAVKNAEELRDLLQPKPPGESLKLNLERKRKSLELIATLGATSRPLKPGAQRLTLGVRITENFDAQGAAIESVVAASPAEKAGLKVGDVLVTVDGEHLPTRDSLREHLDEKQPGDSVKLTLIRNGEDMNLEAKLAAASGAQGGQSRGLWKKDVFRLAVVLVEYPDVKHNARITTNDWSDFFFSTNTYMNRSNVTGQAVHGSFNDYYQEVSSGALRVEGRVFDWVEVKLKRADYAQGTNASNKGRFLSEALDLLREREGDDVLAGFDGLMFLHAGERVNTANRGSLYWPHQAGFDYRKKGWRYFICPEGGKRMASTSVFCHEFGHILGLPDLYARPENPGSEGLGIWCCMSNEAGGGRPQHFSAWCKEQLGWLKPVTIDPTVKQKLILNPVERSTNECFKVLVRPDGSEYLLLENRRRKGFDRSLPGNGLLIWRVVGGRPILEESHGVEGAAGPGMFQTSVPYPSRANNAFTPYTTPSSRSLLGGGWPVFITNIQEHADGRVTFQIGYEFQ